MQFIRSALHGRAKTTAAITLAVIAAAAAAVGDLR